MTTTNERAAILAKLAKGEVPTIAEIEVLNQIAAEAAAEAAEKAEADKKAAEAAAAENAKLLKEYVKTAAANVKAFTGTSVELNEMLLKLAAEVPGLPVPEPVAPTKVKKARTPKGETAGVSDKSWNKPINPLEAKEGSFARTIWGMLPGKQEDLVTNLLTAFPKLSQKDALYHVKDKIKRMSDHLTVTDGIYAQKVVETAGTETK